MRLSKRVSLISPSPTLGISARAAELKKAGVKVVDLGAGQPDFDTPENIKTAAKRAIDNGFTKYTPTSGIAELKQAICRKLERENGIKYSPEEIVVSCGAKHTLFNVLFALLEEGDEVLIPSPYWVSYPEMVKLAGGKPVFLQTNEDNGFKISAEQLQSSLTSKTKVLILNSPCNPTGAVYTREELREIAKVLVENQIYCISDEVYEKFIYEGEHTSIATFAGMRELTVVVNAVSKTYSMTGWRIGYMAGPKELASAVSKIQDHTTSNPTSISQYAALEALTGPQESVEKMVRVFKERRDFVVQRLNAMGVRCSPPPGAFYVFPRISQFYGGPVHDSVSFCEKLLEKEGVAVVPGSAFGSDEHIRISYATSMEALKEGMDGLERFLSLLGK
jgi:aspartate aminotransferase